MGPAQDMIVLQSIYSKRLSRGQFRSRAEHRYSADAEWGVLDEGAHWRHLANTIERPLCGRGISFYNSVLIHHTLASFVSNICTLWAVKRSQLIFVLTSSKVDRF